MERSILTTKQSLQPNGITLRTTTLPRLLARRIQHGTRCHAFPKHSRCLNKTVETEIIPSTLATQTAWRERVGHRESPITATKETRRTILQHMPRQLMRRFGETGGMKRHALT
ncbi:hypothetical protein MANES_S048216v8 [Manihot esculenta]|uniref:Uncharacterized protein n=1 Tax=Manihot esculenta TaxID=3983 RepID=A0ACB7FVH0_MANES|nr:hypothetical protein MANES_S048216v8 [Manihot esculenta]